MCGFFSHKNAARPMPSKAMSDDTPMSVSSSCVLSSSPAAPWPFGLRLVRLGRLRRRRESPARSRSALPRPRRARRHQARIRPWSCPPVRLAVTPARCIRPGPSRWRKTTASATRPASCGRRGHGARRGSRPAPTRGPARSAQWPWPAARRASARHDRHGHLPRRAAGRGRQRSRASACCPWAP